MRIQVSLINGLCLGIESTPKDANEAFGFVWGILIDFFFLRVLIAKFAENEDEEWEDD